MTDADVLDELTDEEQANGDAEAETPEKVEAPHPPCECGCGGVPTRKRSKFLPGHDARLKSQLYTAIREGNEDGATDEQRAAGDAALTRLKSYDWPEPAPKRPKAKKAKPTADGETAPDGEVNVDDLADDSGVEPESLSDEDEVEDL